MKRCDYCGKIIWRWQRSVRSCGPDGAPPYGPYEHADHYPQLKKLKF